MTNLLEEADGGSGGVVLAPVASHPQLLLLDLSDYNFGSDSTYHYHAPFLSIVKQQIDHQLSEHLTSAIIFSLPESPPRMPWAKHNASNIELYHAISNISQKRPLHVKT